nr:reverse transcriptase domain-containing protein [Tanacetum cinerariifolium]
MSVIAEITVEAFGRKLYETDNEEEEDNDEDKLIYADHEEALVTLCVLIVAVSNTNYTSWLRNDIFQTKFTSKGKVCSIIINGGSCENMVATSMVEKPGLDVEDHLASYQLTWLKKGNVIKISKHCLVHFLSGKNIKKGV